MVENKYYNLAVDDASKKAKIDIFGEITSWPWLESDVSSHKLSKELEKLEDVTEIEVHINSYGGEVAEGLAIYNSLKNHKAKIKTIVDGFACSIASVIFMAGDERVMNNASLLMIHQAWTSACGNSKELEKAAADLEKITKATANAYYDVASISEEEIDAMLEEETWISPAEALDYGFATEVYAGAEAKYNQSVKKEIMRILKANSKKEPKNTPKPANSKNKDNKEKSLISLFHMEVK